MSGSRSERRVPRARRLPRVKVTGLSVETITRVANLDLADSALHAPAAGGYRGMTALRLYGGTYGASALATDRYSADVGARDSFAAVIAIRRSGASRPAPVCLQSLEIGEQEVLRGR